MARAKVLSYGVFALLALGSAWAVAADPPAKPKQDPQRAERLKLLRQLAEQVQVSVVGEESQDPASMKMLAEATPKRA